MIHPIKSVLTAGLLAISTQASAISQTVYLNFTSGAGAVGTGAHSYSAAEMGFIAGTMSDLYAPFGVTFVGTAPTSGAFATIIYNSGAIGTSSGVDFRNTSKFGTASIDALAGLDFAGIAAPTSAEIVAASINLGSHELNHLLGARHSDAFSLPGFGVSSAGNSSKFDPVYTGPESATFTGSEFMSLTTVLGFSAAKLTSPDLFIGPRTAMKILFPDHGISHAGDTGTTYDTIGPPPGPGPQSLTKATYELPNALPVPDGDPLKDAKIFASTMSVRGEISTDAESDYYSFSGVAGEVWTIEVLSETIDSFLTEGDLSLALLFDTGGGLVPYYADTAFNLEGLEGFDPLILDIILPADGTYVIEVFGDTPTTHGEYELLLSSFEIVPVPLPAAAWLMLTGLGLFATRLRQKTNTA